jgi:hypothetical protein
LYQEANVPKWLKVTTEMISERERRIAHLKSALLQARGDYEIRQLQAKIANERHSLRLLKSLLNKMRGGR